MLLRFVPSIKYWNKRRFSSVFANADTVFAVSSGQGKCGVAVIRVSGRQAGVALKLLTAKDTLPRPRYAMLTSIKNPRNGETLDKGLVLWFPGPYSFTGEDSCEFQVHGGFAVVTSILKALGSVNNLRAAEPGEFTRRAFYNGKLDLTEVEGIADLLAAETEVQRQQAFLQTEGSLSKVYQEWKTTLIQCLANLEAYIDFEETEVLESDILDRVTVAATQLSDDIRRHLRDARKGECLRNGVKTVILGEPNVGKSSLFNILCQRPAAIVTPLAGTTRDVLEVTLDISGYPLVLADTAGLHSHTTNIVEKEGIERALKTYYAADLIFGDFTNFLKSYMFQLNVTDLLNSSGDLENTFKKPCIIIANKIDLIESHDMHIFEKLKVNLISCKSEDGFSLLLEGITNKLQFLCGVPSKEHPSMNQIRHRLHITRCLNHLEMFLNQSNKYRGTDISLMTEDIRKALRQLGKITGEVTTEQLLDFIFKEFCIGK